IGAPKGWTKKQHLLFIDEAKRETNRIFKLMEKQGNTPENEMAKKSLQAAFEMIAEPVTPRDRLAAIRTVLEFTKTKPATKTDMTVRTAEDFLDELAAEDGNQKEDNHSSE